MNLNILLHTGKIQKKFFFFFQQFFRSSEFNMNALPTMEIQSKSVDSFKKKIISKDFTLDYLMNLRD